MNTTPLLLQLALDLTKNLESSDRLQRLLSAVKETLRADAAALLLYDGKNATVFASHGLSEKGQVMSWVPIEQPRLDEIFRSDLPVIFPSDSHLADPFDGHLAEVPDALHSVHSCMGIPLKIDGRLLGCLTADALSLHAFDDFSMDFLSTLGALASVALKASLERENLESQALRKEEWAKSLQMQMQTDFIGESPVTKVFKKELLLVAKSPYQLLLTGETGVGKEVAARLAHKMSARADKPFVTVNCAAIPENILESELFGHMKGSYTGAIKDRPGYFEIADGGTLFLDELGELPIHVQAKLLRVLQEGEVQRLGAVRPQKVDVRIIAATNKDLESEVKLGRFRADLFHRIAVFPIKIPPLRNRLEDIPLLAKYFAQSAQRQLHCNEVQIQAEAMKWLMLGTWPGNVRELRNVILAGVLRAKNRSGEGLVFLDVLDFEGLGQKRWSESQAEKPSLIKKEVVVDSFEDGLPFKEKIEAYKKSLIEKSLSENDENWSLTAKKLGLDRSNLFNLAKRLGLR